MLSKEAFDRACDDMKYHTYKTTWQVADGLADTCIKLREQNEELKKLLNYERKVSR